jgi:SHS2 domain-containing protein
MTYKFLDDITLADVAFEAKGKDLEKLFESCGKAFTESMVAELKSIEPKEEREIILREENEEKLLYNFLDELIFFKDTEQLLFSEFSIKIEKDKVFTLRGKLKGEKRDMKKHELLSEVKAVTWHKFKVEKKDVWRALVILDV